MEISPAGRVRHYREPMSDGPVRVVLVDDHEMVIEGLKAMLAPFSSRVEVVGEAVGAENAISVIDELAPDIVLSDVRMAGISGLDLCREIRERDPDRKVILLSVYDDEQYLFQAMRVGASGYLLKGISSDELVRQLEGVQAGSTAIDETVKTHLSSVYRKLGVGDRTSAAAMALREGIFR